MFLIKFFEFKKNFIFIDKIFVFFFYFFNKKFEIKNEMLIKFITYFFNFLNNFTSLKKYFFNKIHQI